jgi:signal transduction histidine kinase
MHEKLIHILLVDDDPGDRRLVMLALTKSRQPVQFAIETAESVAMALEHLKNNSFDLVLLDLGLPDSRGLATVDRVCQAIPHIPVVVLTVLADEETGVEAIKKGASDYLVKSKYFSDLLVRTIRYSLERKRAHEEREKLNKDLETAVRELSRSNKELQDFAYIIAHDLKAPLRAIGTLADWMSTDYADKFDEEGRKQMKLLRGRVDRMHNLIEAVLQYSRLGREKENWVQVDLNKLILEVIDMVAPPQNITITTESQLPVIECEATRISQVFQNLLSNAVKYMDKPQGRIRIGCAEDDGFWKFSVADNGCGIEEKHVDRIFKIFQTLAPRDEFESTGIGLTMVKKIVELYGGKIWVQSKPGEGSTFFFTLPKQKKEITDTKLKAYTTN